MSADEHDSRPAPPAQLIRHPAGYTSLIDVQFVSRALAEGATHVRGSQWSTRELFPGHGPDVIASAYYHYNRSFEALASVEGALAHVIRTGDTVTLRLAAADQETLDQAEEVMRRRLPEHGDAEDEVPVEFCHWQEGLGLRRTTRTMTVPVLPDIEANYPSAVREVLREMAAGFRPGHGGRLLLWHGLPGCGKTWALRAIAGEWRDWCQVRYVTDPDRLLGEPSYLVDLIHARSGSGPRRDSWRLIVLEDTGELLAADAKERAGQGLSRLLNVVDGLLGESSKALFLVTTNEDLRVLHPAVSRPGRCAQVLEFGPLAPEEANEWLERAGSDRCVSMPTTLADLFAIGEGIDVPSGRRRPVGFA